MNKSESEIQKELISICKIHYKVAWISRANSGVIRQGKRFIHLHPKGTPDIIGFTIHGQFIGIELKKPSTIKKTSDEQKEMQELMRHNNCVYGVAWDKESLLQILDRIE